MLLLIDVSGSLREHTPDYLRFAWTAQAETFTFGTRLTRITKELRHRDVDAALAAISDTVDDADGGTRIARLSHRLLWWTPLALDPTYVPITRAMAAIQGDVLLAGARDIPSLLEQVKRL